MRQTFHVCTSPVVQSAWDQGQDVAVYGMIYNLKDGRIRKLVGPLSRTNASGMNFIVSPLTPLGVVLLIFTCGAAMCNADLIMIHES